ncbi:MAG: alpha-N-acetylglucosaminidase TIM-barrel domain-containing protein [Thermoguttaceae bacterium]|nr:alpha-N-acetylglucosaminidase TIM-barrel domain-containing protein [Thermoguttaceae bacterium]
MKKTSVLFYCLLFFAIATCSLSAKELCILKPDNRGAAYDVAASEFQKYYEQVCGKQLAIVTRANDVDDYVVIGGDMVNRFVRSLVEAKVLDEFPIGIDSDQYRLLSISTKGRNHLILAGGRGRSTLYAVYEFFERRCGCRWFWDGDVVPKMKSVDLSGLDLTIKPRFDYRGIRYFAHRGLHRFQAEHWSFEDWQKEIDWCVKKRLNMFMLRIGQDDLFQKAFPDIVSYPDASKSMEGMGTGYNNRNLFWSLEYRGKLRKQILDYAFARDLMHPEDFGTMTHWYAPTPQSFLDKVKPTFSPETGKKGKYGMDTLQVWDIRDDVNLDNYWKITQASVDHYGKPEIFHTIGFAERMVYKDRADNFKMKVYFYRRMLENLRSHYPTATILLAGWDFYGWWNKEELKKLFEQLDPNKTIVLDYTLDLDGNNLGKWDMFGKFPYIAGLFLAYESALDIRGRYEYFQETQNQAFADPMCKGLVFWPESSHTDIFMLDYFADNAWQPGKVTTDELLAQFCKDRYNSQSDAFYSVWKDVRKPSQLLSAGGNFWSIFVKSRVPWNATETWTNAYREQQPILQVAPSIFERLAKMEWSDDFARRDSIDLARTMADRILTCARFRVFNDMNLWRTGKLDAAHAVATIDAFEKITEAMTNLLALHDDYSLHKTLVRMNKVEPIRNPDFDKVLIDNASNGYCMSHQYELMAYWYKPTFDSVATWAKETLKSNNKNDFVKARTQMIAKRIALLKKTQTTSLANMAPNAPQTHEAYVELMKQLAQASRVIVK